MNAEFPLSWNALPSTHWFEKLGVNRAKRVEGNALHLGVAD